MAWVAEKKEQAASLGRSVLSELIGPPLPLPTLEARHVSCFGKGLDGTVYGEPCQNLKLSANGTTHHCNGCGCGDTPLTQLEPGLVLSKLLYPRLECPLKKRGFSNEFTDDDFDAKKRIVIWDPVNGGMGDVIASMWISMGYLDLGWKVEYLNSNHNAVLSACGFKDFTNDWTRGTWKLGNEFPAYAEELRNQRGKYPRLHSWSAWLPSSPVPRKPPLLLPAEAEMKARELWGNRKIKVVMSPLALWRARNWPLCYWYDLYALLVGAGIEPLVIAAKEQASDVAGFSNAQVGLSWLETIAVIEQADLFLGQDSGAAWAASLTDTRGLVLCGPTKNILGGISNLREIRTTPDRMWCVGCHFHAEGGYRAACDYGCQALMAYRPADYIKEVWQELDEIHPHAVPRSAVDHLPVSGKSPVHLPQINHLPLG